MRFRQQKTLKKKTLSDKRIKLNNWNSVLLFVIIFWSVFPAFTIIGSRKVLEKVQDELFNIDVARDLLLLI